MSRKAYFLPVTDSHEAQVALDQLEAAGIEINFAVTGPQLTCWEVPQGAPLSDGQYCYLGITSEGDITYYIKDYPALSASFRLDGVDDEFFNADGSLIGGTYLDEVAFVQYLAAFD